MKKTIVTLILLALLTACGGDDGSDDPSKSNEPVACAASASCG